MTAIKRPPAPWSFSSLSTYSSCPKKYYHLKVVKDVIEAPGDAAMWGDTVHKALESRLRDKVPLPKELNMYEPYAEAIERIKGTMYVEQQLAITKDCKPCAWDDPEVWCRGIVDVLHIDGGVARVLDHKTGKRKPDSKQLALFALLVFYHYPQVHTCKTAFMWVKSMERDVAEYSVLEIPDLWNLYLPELTKYSKSFKTDEWPVNTSGLCKNWCPVHSCTYNGKYKGK